MLKRIYLIHPTIKIVHQFTRNPIHAPLISIATLNLPLSPLTVYTNYLPDGVGTRHSDTYVYNIAQCAIDLLPE